MPPTKDDLEIVAELEAAAASFELLTKHSEALIRLADLLRRAAQELHEFNYRVWELEMGEDL
jgi:hypothetical protein